MSRVRLRRLLALALIWQQHSLDVRKDTTLRNCHTADQFVQLFIIVDGELQMMRDDACFLVIACRFASELQNLGRQVLEHSRQIDRSTDALGTVASAEKPVDMAHGKLQSGIKNECRC